MKTLPESARVPYDAAALTSAPLRIEGEAQFAAPAEQVFAKLADLEGVGRFVPFIRHATVDHSQSRTAGAVDAGCVRTCTVTGLGATHERIVLWDPPHGYAYSASGTRLPVRDHLGVIFVERHAAASVLVWRQYFRTRRTPLGALFPVMMQWLMQRALTNLGKELGGPPALVYVKKVSGGEAAADRP